MAVAAAALVMDYNRDETRYVRGEGGRFSVREWQAKEKEVDGRREGMSETVIGTCRSNGRKEGTRPRIRYNSPPASSNLPAP